MAKQSLESNLNELFVKKAPPLPAGGKKFLVEYLPWINLILGLLSLYTAYVLWHWAHIVNGFANYANSLSAVYGGPQVASNRMTFGIWLGLAVLIAEGVLYVAAFPGTRDRKKSGWNLLYYALILNIVYGVVVLFTDYGGFGSLLGTVIGSGIGLYLLFQIRSSYAKSGARKKA